MRKPAYICPECGEQVWYIGAYYCSDENQHEPILSSCACDLKYDYVDSWFDYSGVEAEDDMPF